MMVYTTFVYTSFSIIQIQIQFKAKIIIHLYLSCISKFDILSHIYYYSYLFSYITSYAFEYKVLYF